MFLTLWPENKEQECQCASGMFFLFNIFNQSMNPLKLKLTLLPIIS